jgi:hypothetical protein
VSRRDLEEENIVVTLLVARGAISTPIAGGSDLDQVTEAIAKDSANSAKCCSWQRTEYALTQ